MLRLFCQSCGVSRELTMIPMGVLTCRCGSVNFGTRPVKLLRRWTPSANDRRFLRSLRIAPDDEAASPVTDDGA